MTPGIMSTTWLRNTLATVAAGNGNALSAALLRDHISALETQHDELIQALTIFGARVECAVCGGATQHQPVNTVWHCPRGATAHHPDVSHVLATVKP